MSGPDAEAAPAVTGPSGRLDTAPQVRRARDTDASGLVALVRVCFSEYEGCVLDTEEEMPHLLRPAAHFTATGGCAWVAETEGAVVGSVACRPAADAGGLELQMLYVSAPGRRRGLGSLLVALVEDEARLRGATFVDLWTDTRFTDAHRLYHSLGYDRHPGVRELHDLSATVEFHFTKVLTPGA
jgi:putative acetyltransferase